MGLLSAGILSGAVTARDVPHAFLMAVMVYPDELYDSDFCQMSFAEFLHGLGAVAFLHHEPTPLREVLERLMGVLAQGQPAGLLTGLLRALGWLCFFMANLDHFLRRL